MRFGEHRDIRKRVSESSRLKDTIRVVDSKCYSPDGEPKDSVDQDTREQSSLPVRFSFVFHRCLVFSEHSQMVEPRALQQSLLCSWYIVCLAYPCLQRCLLQGAAIGNAQSPGRVVALLIDGIEIGRSLFRALAAGQEVDARHGCRHGAFEHPRKSVTRIVIFPDCPDASYKGNGGYRSQ